MFRIYDNWLQWYTDLWLRHRKKEDQKIPLEQYRGILLLKQYTRGNRGNRGLWSMAGNAAPPVVPLGDEPGHEKNT